MIQWQSNNDKWKGNASRKVPILGKQKQNIGRVRKKLKQEVPQPKKHLTKNKALFCTNANPDYETDEWNLECTVIWIQIMDYGMETGPGLRLFKCMY